MMESIYSGPCICTERQGKFWELHKKYLESSLVGRWILRMLVFEITVILMILPLSLREDLLRKIWKMNTRKQVLSDEMQTGYSRTLCEKCK